MGDGQLVYDNFNYLKKKNIKEILIAGEGVWWCGRACLGVVLKSLETKFKVNGIKGCVYPEKKPSVLDSIEEKNTILDNLLIRRFYNKLISV
jgi:hypothetical protein